MQIQILYMSSQTHTQTHTHTHTHTYTHKQTHANTPPKNHSGLVCRFGANRGRKMGQFPGICSEIMGFMPFMFSQNPKNTDMLFLVWTGTQHTKRTSIFLLFKDRKKYEGEKKEEAEEKKEGEVRRFVWKSLCLYHQNGTIKKQGRRREGRGNGVVMNVVPQLPSFRVFIFHFY